MTVRNDSCPMRSMLKLFVQAVFVLTQWSQAPGSRPGQQLQLRPAPSMAGVLGVADCMTSKNTTQSHYLQLANQGEAHSQVEHNTSSC